MVTIYESEAKATKLEAIKDIIEMILIVSKVEVKVGEKHVEVTKAPGAKCERCWKYSEEVGNHAEHSTICPRCIDAITK